MQLNTDFLSKKLENKKEEKGNFNTLNHSEILNLDIFDDDELEE